MQPTYFSLGQLPTFPFLPVPLKHLHPQPPRLTRIFTWHTISSHLLSSYLSRIHHQSCSVCNVAGKPRSRGRDHHRHSRLGTASFVLLILVQSTVRMWAPFVLRLTEKAQGLYSTVVPAVRIVSTCCGLCRRQDVRGAAGLRDIWVCV
jgi:hypothetical protein